jgi:hypothetical protein
MTWINDATVITADDLKLTADQVKLSRESAYADPHTGSDRLLAEYQRLDAIGSEDAEDKKVEWLERCAEIKSDNPWPEE